METIVKKRRVPIARDLGDLGFSAVVGPNLGMSLSAVQSHLGNTRRNHRRSAPSLTQPLLDGKIGAAFGVLKRQPALNFAPAAVALPVSTIVSRSAYSSGVNHS